MAGMKEDLGDFPHFSEFLQHLNSSSFLRGALTNIDALYVKYGREYLRLGEDILVTMKKLGVNSVTVFEAYMYEYLRDLARFQSSGEYDNGSFDEIREKIYDNAALMSETYLPGLFIAYGFTSILYEKYRIFERAFVPQLDRNMRGVEIGFGDGFYLWSILKQVPEISVNGLDISQHALDFTARLLSASGFSQVRYDLRLGNLCERVLIDDATQDWCILAEVIEHVADPVFSLREIFRIMKARGLLFMCTVIDSNHMDHITNFDSPQVVVDLLQSAGFTIQDSLQYETSKELKGLQDQSIGLAYVCSKAG
jgi:ubiquinone/menaquinone biosynthesis C-methylase UbiE